MTSSRMDPEELAVQVKVALVRQSLEDPEYRRLALADPRRAVRANRFVGTAADAIPHGLQFRVVEETPTLLYLVIPHGGAAPPAGSQNPKDVLLHKAMTSPDYLSRLTADPRAMLEAEFLIEVPPGFDVRVLRETWTERIAVLPADLHGARPAGVPDGMLEYQAKAWGGGDCKKSFLGSIIENLCPHAPHETEFESPFCTTTQPEICQVQPL
jgi:Nitrile hydratase, alpha chain